MKMQWLSKKWVKVSLHISVWVLLFSLPSLLRPTQNQAVPQVQHENYGIKLLYQYLLNCFSWVFVFYTNSYFLIPFFFNKKRYIQYFFSLFPMFIILLIVNRISFLVLFPDHAFSLVAFLFINIFPGIFFLSCSTAFTMIGDKIRSENKVKEKETENLKTELAFLRSQVSPHFMFNVLNNMVVLARKQSDQLEPSLFKLSSLMRYMLYETDEKRVQLNKEIGYIESYTDLQIQRFGRKVKVTVLMENNEKVYFIEPMLLIPFVENAFKHGTGWKNHSEINIGLKTKDDILEFEVSNYYNGEVEEAKDETSGIGLQNVKRRLDLLYEKQHVLLITKDDNRFNVSLKLNLH